jgi:hypothetical protein
MNQVTAKKFYPVLQSQLDAAQGLYDQIKIIELYE